MRLPARPLRLLIACLSCVLAGCASLPAHVERQDSQAYTDTSNTRLGEMAGPLETRHPGQSGVDSLLNGQEAFAARWILAGAAQRSIDVQYYIWRPDTSGSLMAHALAQAAARGVRVRVLLDDFNTGGMDDEIAAMNALPNIEVRLFNPFANRTWRLGDYMTDFSRVNRRMHNKAFIVDNQAAVVGGRNIGDEYMGVDDSAVAFTDLDVVTIGPVVADISAEFDRYWNSASAYPVASLLPAPSAVALEKQREDWAERVSSPEAVRFMDSVRSLDLLSQMHDGTLALAWAPAEVLADDPDKVLQPNDRADLLLPKLIAAFGSPREELLVVSAYFVPGRRGTDLLIAMAQRGVHVSVLTNSLAATDVAPVYAGYARYRDELLRAGVHIYELKPTAPPPPPKEGVQQEPSGGAFGSHGGSSGASLHAKTMGVDREQIFVGSFNVDPRSVSLNTEMGLLVKSPELAGQLAQAFDDPIPQKSYELQLQDGAVVWIDHTPAGEVRYTSPPGVSAMRMLWIDFVGVLPIEWLL